MGKLIDKWVDKKIHRLTENKGLLRGVKDEIMKPFAKALKVFVEPHYDVLVKDYEGEPEYFKVFNIKLFKKPYFLINKPWKYNKLNYTFRLGEFVIYGLPEASAVFYGKKISVIPYIPHTNTTSSYNYWLSILEYTEGHGAHSESIIKTVMYLGKASMGIQFNEYNPHVMEVSKGSDTIHADAPNNL